MSNIGMVLWCTFAWKHSCPKKNHQNCSHKTNFFNYFLSFFFLLHTFQLSSAKLRSQTKEFSSTKHKRNGSFSSMTMQCAYAPPTAFLSWSFYVLSLEVFMCSLEVCLFLVSEVPWMGLPEVSKSSRSFRWLQEFPEFIRSQLPKWCPSLLKVL